MPGNIEIIVITLNPRDDLDEGETVDLSLDCLPEVHTGVLYLETQVNMRTCRKCNSCAMHATVTISDIHYLSKAKESVYLANATILQILFAFQ
jgi:hypothetical protein